MNVSRCLALVLGLGSLPFVADATDVFGTTEPFSFTLSLDPMIAPSSVTLGPLNEVSGIGAMEVGGFFLNYHILEGDTGGVDPFLISGRFLYGSNWEPVEFQAISFTADVGWAMALNAPCPDQVEVTFEFLDPGHTGGAITVEGTVDAVCFPNGIPEASAGWPIFLALGGTAAGRFRRRITAGV